MRPSFHLLFVLALVAPASVRADNKSEAKEHLDRASVAHKEGRFADALTELNIAYTLDPQPALLYAIGQVHVMQGQCSEAIAFYERFIAAEPEPSQAAKAREAIETCKRLQPDKKPDKEPDKEPDKVIVTPPPKTTTIVTTTSPWYSDWLGNGLVIGGLTSGIASVLFYSAALGDRDRAELTTSYDAYDELVERAQREQKVALVFAAGGAVLATAGIISYAVRDRTVEKRVAVTPTAGGALVIWGARF